MALKLVLADEQGRVLQSWIIGGHIEFDIDEEPDREPDCDFYVFDGQADSHEIGSGIIHAAQTAFKQGQTP